jgi:hypothetical protein
MYLMGEADLRTAIGSPRLIRLLDYWDSRRSGATPPARSDIDPIEIPDLLGSIALIEAEGVPRRLRYRLVGSDLYEAHGGDMTGRYVDEVLTPELRAVILAQFAEVLDAGAPRLHRIEIDDSEGNFWRYERLTLPLAGRDGTVVMLLCGYADLGGRGFLRLRGERSRSGPRS